MDLCTLLRNKVNVSINNLNIDRDLYHFNFDLARAKSLSDRNRIADRILDKYVLDNDSIRLLQSDKPVKLVRT